MVALLSGITPEEYLEQERKAEFKSEYVNGRVYAMAGTSEEHSGTSEEHSGTSEEHSGTSEEHSGTSEEHSTIAMNIGSELRFQLKGRPCKAYTSDLRVGVEITGKYAYPDVSVVCGDRRFADTTMDTLLNPTVLVEVLSPSTERYDRGGKFAHYRRLASLQEYVMVAQNQTLVERYSRQGEQWVLTEYKTSRRRAGVAVYSMPNSSARNLRQGDISTR